MDRYPSQLLLSSQHDKERILGPIFEAYGHKIVSNKDFNTDNFGTFCGSIERKEGPKITVSEKCLAGMAHAKSKYGMASEGSFGPHPLYPFLNYNEEWLVYIDLEKRLEIFGYSCTMDVCHSQISHSEAQKLPEFLNQCGFGAQGLVLKDLKTNEVIIKGIQDRETLDSLLTKHDFWQLETDLRAHMNPTRQKNIAAAGRDLLKRMYSFCPMCGSPDFVIKELKGHLLCAQCLKATESHEFEVSICTNCKHQNQERRKDKTEEDPQFCQYCNP